tara:strand:- start:1307 stop:1471 length:165 start_codon:yes stop_codon:yes gene_type:complete
MSESTLANKIMTVLQKGLSDSQDNKREDSAEYRIGKMDAYSEVLSVINLYSKSE